MQHKGTPMQMRSRTTATAGLLALIAALVGLVLTSETEQSAGPTPVQGVRLSRFVVDERPVLTARALAHFAATPDERVDAEEALASADDEVEVGFVDALRDVEQHPMPLTPEAKALEARVSEAARAVAEDQKQVDALTKLLALVVGAKKGAVESQLEVAHAQLELDQDELQDAKQDLGRIVGDPSRRAHQIKRQVERHKLFEQQHGLGASAAESATDNSDAGYDAGNLVAQVGAWYTLTRKATLLRRAITEANDKANALSNAHDVLEARAEAVSRGGDSRTGRPSTISPPLTGMDPEALAHLTKQEGDEEDLATTYTDWFDFVAVRQRVAQRGMIRSFLWIMLTIPFVFFTGRTVGYFISKASQKHPHLAHLDGMFRFAIQAAGVLLILIVILGFPQHVPEAIFGVVGAGVTVALKDFSGNFIDSRIRGLLGAVGKQGNAAA
jgi:hypothetical protein